MRFGSVTIDRGLLLAPMDGITDLPFRILCRRLGADLVYSEFVHAEELLRGNPRMRRKLVFREEERPFGIQIYGADPAALAEAAQRLAEYAPDVIDINCGCWVRDVAGRGAGAGLLRDLPQLERIVRAVVRAVRVPVTVKTRIGWDAHSIRILDVARVCEAAGAAAVTVHGRTRARGHAGPADHSWIPRIRAAVSIPVIANGGIDSAEDVARVFTTTGCDAVMIGRAAIRDPWVFAHARHLMRTGERLPSPSPAQRLDLFRQHLDVAVTILGTREGVFELRKHCLVLLRGLPHVEPIRRELRHVQDPAAILDHIARYVELYTSNKTAEPAAHGSDRPC